jgi:catechol 2,3-dioxygenase-like lactoylglutathione lyase family enzyme
MRFVNPIAFVRDIDLSRAFYCDIVGLIARENFEHFVLFDTGFAIHDGKALARTVWGQVPAETTSYGRQNLLLYFEHDDIHAAFSAIGPQAELIHPLERQAWGSMSFASMTLMGTQSRSASR